MIDRYSKTQDGYFRVSTFKGSLYCVQYNTIKGESLPMISFKHYGDSRLWWAIAIVNDIDDPFDFVINTPKVVYIPHESEVSKL